MSGTHRILVVSLVLYILIECAYIIMTISMHSDFDAVTMLQNSSRNRFSRNGTHLRQQKHHSQVNTINCQGFYHVCYFATVYVFLWSHKTVKIKCDCLSQRIISLYLCFAHGTQGWFFTVAFYAIAGFKTVVLGKVIYQNFLFKSRICF